MIRAILVDDEPLSLQLMKKKLHNVGGIDIIATFSDTETVLQEMKNLDFQVAFLDIEMAGLSGLDLAEIMLDYNSNLKVVFVTAYREYAIQAFELNSLDCLLKPVMKDRLEKTVARLQERIEQEANQQKINSTLPTFLNIQCMKEFKVHFGQELLKWKTIKVKELFAFFIFHLNTDVHRDTIIDAIWPNQEYKKAKILLHTNI